MQRFPAAPAPTSGASSTQEILRVDDRWFGEPTSVLEFFATCEIRHVAADDQN